MAGSGGPPLRRLSAAGTIALLDTAFRIAGSPDKLPTFEIMITGVFRNGFFYQGFTGITGTFFFAFSSTCGCGSRFPGGNSMTGSGGSPLGLLSAPGAIALLNTAFRMTGGPDKLP